MMIGLKQVSVGIAALASATVAPAELRPSTPDAIADAAVDCWQSVGPAAVDEAKLRALGWKAGSTSANGRPIDIPVKVYGKSGSNVMLMLMNTGGQSGCVITALVPKVEDIRTAAQSLLMKLRAIDPAVKGARQGQSVAYVSLPRVAQLAPAGTAQKPATRIIIGYNTSEAK
ncbi:MAG TPA: hypothetical protein VJT70_06560 [Sphingomicrobium sp.]|nr:hypothetical protein [Sphingomicrobium sp.]